MCIRSAGQHCFWRLQHSCICSWIKRSRSQEWDIPGNRWDQCNDWSEEWGWGMVQALKPISDPELRHEPSACPAWLVRSCWRDPVLGIVNWLYQWTAQIVPWLAQNEVPPREVQRCSAWWTGIKIWKVQNIEASAPHSLTVFPAVTAPVSCMAGLITSLTTAANDSSCSATQKAKCSGFLKKIANYQFIATCFFLKDCLEKLSSYANLCKRKLCSIMMLMSSSVPL